MFPCEFCKFFQNNFYVGHPEETEFLCLLLPLKMHSWGVFLNPVKQLWWSLFAKTANSQILLKSYSFVDVWKDTKYTLHKKWSFLLRPFSVNVTKSAGNGFGHIYWRNLSWKTSLFSFVQWRHCCSLGSYFCWLLKLQAFPSLNCLPQIKSKSSRSGSDGCFLKVKMIRLKKCHLLAIICVLVCSFSKILKLLLLLFLFVLLLFLSEIPLVIEWTALITPS